MIAIFPELVQAARTFDVEKLAVLTRKYFGEGDTFRPAPDVERLVRAVGIRIERFITEGRGALLAKDQNGCFAIVAVVEPELDETATRFLLAHQLGHFLLDIQALIAQGDWQISGYRESQCPQSRYAAGGPAAPVEAVEARREERADAFAAALLMPAGMAKMAYERLKTVDKVAAFFRVTPAVARRRCELLGLIQPKAPVSFLDAESRLVAKPRATRSTQPMDSTPPSSLATSLGGSAQLPRAFAAARYGQTEQATRQIGSESEQTAGLAPAREPLTSTVTAPQSVVDKVATASQGPKGLARIRELAMKLEEDRIKRTPSR